MSYKNQLEGEINLLVQENEINFEVFRNFMEDIQTISEQDAKLIIEAETSPRKTVMSVAGLTYNPILTAAQGGSPGQVVGAAVGGAGVWAAYRLIRAAFDKCTSRCGLFKINDEKRQECMMKCKKEYLTKKLAAKNK